MNESTAIPHVLIVEDEEILLKFLVYHVEHAGYRATAITKGGEIFSILQRDPADLILMDLGLPDGDGLTWTQQIRETTNVPIVVLTGRQGDDDRIMALGLGADDYLTKPCDPRELLLRMRNIIDRGQRDAPPATPADVAAPTAPPKPAPRPAPGPAPDQAVAQGDRRGDVRQDRRQSNRRDRPGGKSINLPAIAISAVIFLAAGAGLTWFLLAGDDGPASPRTVAEAPPVPAAKNSPDTDAPFSQSSVSPGPEPKTEPDTLSRSVIATPQHVEGDDAPVEKNTGLPTDVETDRPVAATSYSWVLKAKCPAIPDVPWWRVRSHTEIVRYVNTRHSGDWLPYLKSWVIRLNKLKDIHKRGSGIRTKTNETLTGEALQAYIAQMSQRVEAVKCLSKAAADYAYKRSQLRN